MADGRPDGRKLGCDDGANDTDDWKIRLVGCSDSSELSMLISLEDRELDQTDGISLGVELGWEAGLELDPCSARMRAHRTRLSQRLPLRLMRHPRRRP